MVNERKTEEEARQRQPLKERRAYKNKRKRRQGREPEKKAEPKRIGNKPKEVKNPTAPPSTIDKRFKRVVRARYMPDMTTQMRQLAEFNQWLHLWNIYQQHMVHWHMHCHIQHAALIANGGGVEISAGENSVTTNPESASGSVMSLSSSDESSEDENTKFNQWLERWNIYQQYMVCWQRQHCHDSLITNGGSVEISSRKDGAMRTPEFASGSDTSWSSTWSNSGESSEDGSTQSSSGESSEDDDGGGAGEIQLSSCESSEDDGSSVSVMRSSNGESL